MRIRKRFHLLSSLSSDPQVMKNQSSLVQVQVQERNGHPKVQYKKTNSQKSDLKNQDFDGQLSVKPTWVSQTVDSLPSSSKVRLDLEVEEVNDEKKRVEEEDEEVKKNSKNDIIIKKECTLNEEVNISSLDPFSSLSHQDGLEVPLKKKKWSFERRKKEDDQYPKNPEWKSKINKRCTMFQDDDNLQLLAKATEENAGDVIGNSSSTSWKGKKIRGSVIMEGSRCSRMNGRGWRCCQPTLVGYSLCEHHLGKGRLRSMSSSSVNALNLKKKKPMGTSAVTPTDDDRHDDDEQIQELPTWFRRTNNSNREDDDDDDEKVSPVVVKTKKKLGKVRARSMSSLLVAIDNETMAASQEPQKQ